MFQYEGDKYSRNNSMFLPSFFKWKMWIEHCRNGAAHNAQFSQLKNIEWRARTRQEENMG